MPPSAARSHRTAIKPAKAKPKLRLKKCPCGSRRPLLYATVPNQGMVSMAMVCPACNFLGRPGLGKVTLARLWNEAVEAAA